MPSLTAPPAIPASMTGKRDWGSSDTEWSLCSPLEAEPREGRTCFSAPDAPQPRLSNTSRAAASAHQAALDRQALTTGTEQDGHLHTLGCPQDLALGAWEVPQHRRSSEASSRGYYKANFTNWVFSLITEGKETEQPLKTYHTKDGGKHKRVGQKVVLDFSVTSYGETEQTFGQSNTTPGFPLFIFTIGF